MAPTFAIPFYNKTQQKRLLDLDSEYERIPFMEKLFQFLKNIDYIDRIPFCTTDTLATMNQLSTLMDGEWRAVYYYKDVVPFLEHESFQKGHFLILYDNEQNSIFVLVKLLDGSVKHLYVPKRKSIPFTHTPLYLFQTKKKLIPPKPSTTPKPTKTVQMFQKESKQDLFTFSKNPTVKNYRLFARKYHPDKLVRENKSIRQLGQTVFKKIGKIHQKASR